MREPLLTTQLLLRRWQYDMLAERKEAMCFGVNRLERPGKKKKNAIRRCKARYSVVASLGAVNNAGRAALPGQDGGCRAKPSRTEPCRDGQPPCAPARCGRGHPRNATAARGGGAGLAAAEAALQPGTVPCLCGGSLSANMHLERIAASGNMLRLSASLEISPHHSAGDPPLSPEHLSIALWIPFCCRKNGGSRTNTPPPPQHFSAPSKNPVARSASCMYTGFPRQTTRTNVIPETSFPRTFPAPLPGVGRKKLSRTLV